MASKTKVNNAKVKVVKTPEQKKNEKLAKMNNQFQAELVQRMRNNVYSFVICRHDSFYVANSDNIYSDKFNNNKIYMRINNKLVYLKNIEDAYKKIRLKALECKNSYGPLSIYKYANNSLTISKGLNVSRGRSTEYTKIYIIENGKFRLCKDALMFDIGSVEYDKIQVMLNKPMNELSINEMNVLYKHKLMPESAKDREIKELKDTLYELNLGIQSSFGRDIWL